MTNGKYTYIAYKSQRKKSDGDDLPVAVAATAAEMGKILGMKPSSVFSLVNRGGGTKRGKFIIFRYPYTNTQ